MSFLLFESTGEYDQLELLAIYRGKFATPHDALVTLPALRCTRHNGREPGWHVLPPGAMVTSTRDMQVNGAGETTYWADGYPPYVTTDYDGAEYSSGFVLINADSGNYAYANVERNDRELTAEWSWSWVED